MRAFVISLPAAAARREQIVPQLERAGISFEIVGAVSGSEIADDLHRYCPSLYSPRYGWNMTLNEVACCVSHGRALEAFLVSGETCGLILEDDAVVPPETKIAIVRCLPTKFDVLKVGGIGEAAPITSAMRVRRTNKPTMGAHAYVVSQSGAQKLLSRLTPVTVQYDSYLRHVYEHGCIVFETVPHLVSANDGGISHIGERSIKTGPLTFQNWLRSTWWQFRHNVLHSLYKLRHGRETEWDS
jgi:glycosyl transferase family 25